MPQLEKGGKWVFGWVIAGINGEIAIPPEAYHEYGFQPGEVLFLTCGSRTSGGFGLGKQSVLAEKPIRARVWAQAVMGERMRVVLPEEVVVQPGERLLVVRGSGLALGFLRRGPIYELALNHPEVESFT